MSGYRHPAGETLKADPTALTPKMNILKFSSSPA